MKELLLWKTIALGAIFTWGFVIMGWDILAGVSVLATFIQILAILA